MIYRGTCHCSKVQFELESNLSIIVQCNCSICKRKGIKMNIVEENKLSIKKGEELLSVYQFKTHKAKHFFCSNCGIYTHHFPRTKPGYVGINIGCLDGVDSFSTEAKLLEGIKL